MMQVFPLFQKWNFIHKTRYGDHCFIIPFLWHFWNKIFVPKILFFILSSVGKPAQNLWKDSLFNFYSLIVHYFFCVSCLAMSTIFFKIFGSILPYLTLIYRQNWKIVFLTPTFSVKKVELKFQKLISKSKAIQKLSYLTVNIEIDLSWSSIIFE